ncbi:MAG TPA: cytochrome c biogenesis protein ResB [Gammaproteobacteria bacterium]
MNEQPQTSRQQRSRSALLLEFLGSMYLAIILLVVIAIASAIGTVLQQNEPYSNYVMKFGPFWFEVFRTLGFYDIYGTAWFLLLVGFLLLSTAVCVWRNTPAILREFRHFRLDVQEKSLRAFHHVSEWSLHSSRDDIAGHIGQLLQQRGYKVRSKASDDRLVIAATRGGAGRLGYIVFHLAIIVICIAGLINGNLPLRFAELTGKVVVETRDLPVSQVPEKSWLGTDNQAFRGSVNIPEGSFANFAFVQMRDGYLVQKLPFTVTLQDFRIEHYPSGMPKSFESDIIITDDTLKEPLHKTISVNHPLSYRGYNIYQASFADGGSQVTLKAWSFDHPASEPLTLNSAVQEKVSVETSRGPLTIEVIDFKLYNIFPAQEGDPSGKQFHNYGPSVTLKVRNAAGEALEYVNYMVPITMEGRLFYLSGMRASPAEDYRFLHLPLDDKGGLGRFMALRARALDHSAVRRIAQQQTLQEMGASGDQAMLEQLTDSIANLVQMFVVEGIDAVVAHTEQNIEPAKRQDALQSYVKVIQSVLGGLYLEQLATEGIDTSNGISDADARYFDDAVNAMSLIGPYGTPFFLQLTDFKQVEASGLQISRAPAGPIIIFGFLLLCAGVFMMLYLHNRHLWVRISGDGEELNVLFAGTSHRNRGDFGEEFDALTQLLRQATTGQNT